jgi:Mn-dependent DtxR family transcriptional regulator
MSLPLYPAPVCTEDHLPRRQLELLRYIRRSRPVFPTTRQMADFMGWKNEASATDCLSRLAWRGYVRREKNGHWRLIK